ncbi:MAG: hypothetical protein JW787_12755 [Sedimentisphaerales bacterium]|nr:hypothetical protein [Sedimentisphaerales bacterium]
MNQKNNTHLNTTNHKKYSCNCGSDCIVLTSEWPTCPSLIARQVTEGLVFKNEDREVYITLILFLENPYTIPMRARVVHRGDVQGWLEPFDFETENEALNLLNRLYSDRIIQNTNDDKSILFYPRVNCLSIAQQPIEYSIAGPEGCFMNEQHKIDLKPENHRGKEPSFTSFLLPPLAPKAKDMFVLNLKFDGATYDYLIGQQPWLSVSSYTRLLNEIATFDTVYATREAKELFYTHIQPNKAHIAPEAYDIVLFQTLGTPVEVMDGSICIIPVRHSDRKLAKEMLWFYGKPSSDFYLELCFRDHPPKLSNNTFIVNRKLTISNK